MVWFWYKKIGGLGMDWLVVNNGNVELFYLLVVMMFLIVIFILGLEYV